MNKLKAADQNLHRAIELSPSNAFAYERLGWSEFFQGKTEYGIAMIEKAIQLDPLSTRYKGSLGSGYYMSNQYDKGITRIKAFLELHPDDNFILWTLAYLYAGKGDYELAIKTLDQRTIGKSTNWVYAYCYGKLGNQAAAQKIVDQMLERKKTGFVPDFMMAVAFASVGRKDEALKALEHASGIGGESFFAWGMKSDPMFASLRNEPRFQKVVQRIEKMYAL